MNNLRSNLMFPTRSHSGLGSIVDDLFNRSLSDMVGHDMVISRPSVNIMEQEDKFTIEVAAPGLEKSDFDLQVNENNITISAQKELKNEEKGEKFTRREFNFSSFSRTFSLPEHVDADNISAKYDNGVLMIDIPKLEREKIENVKRIEIL